MRVTLEPTDRIVDVETDRGGVVRGRVWQGTTDTGHDVAFVVVRVATPAGGDLTEFEQSLVPVTPGRTAREAFPNRLVL